jgi:hypothetical protein
MRSLDAARQQVALRWLHNRDNPSFSDFSAFCARLLTAQAQDSLFDLMALMAEAQVAAEAEEAEGAAATYPVADLPEMKRNGSVGRTLASYIDDLLASGSPELAQAATRWGRQGAGTRARPWAAARLRCALRFVLECECAVVWGIMA